MYHEFECKEVTCRKPHRCEWCNEPIAKGERAQYRAYVWEDGPMSGWMHFECWDAMHELPTRDLMDGWTPGDFERGSTESA